MPEFILRPWHLIVLFLVSQLFMLRKGVMPFDGYRSTNSQMTVHIRIPGLGALIFFPGRCVIAVNVR
jgi:hypothetical protein